MYDIVRCEAKPSKYGFKRFYSYSAIKNKIIQASNVREAVKYKNRSSLVVLRDYSFDEGAIKVIGEKKKLCFLIGLGRLIKIRGIHRAIGISKLRNFLHTCIRFGAYYSFASFADKEEYIRSPGELENIILLFGLNRGQAKFALKMLKHYL